jgi:hypothetical protein
MTLINGFYVSPNDEIVEQTMGKDSKKRGIKKIGIDLAWPRALSNMFLPDHLLPQ